MPEPARDGWNVHSCFNAARGEQVAQIVVRQFGDADNLAGAHKGFLALPNAANWVGDFVTVLIQSLEEYPHVRNDWNLPSRFPVPRTTHFGVVNGEEPAGQ